MKTSWRTGGWGEAAWSRCQAATSVHLSRWTSVLSFLLHESSPKDTLRLELIVGAAAQAKDLDACLATAGQRYLVVILEEPAFLAPVAVGADVGAAVVVALPDFAPHVGGDVALAPGWSPGRPRAVGRREPGLLLLGDQLVERTLQELRDVAARDGVRQQLLRPPELVVHLLRDRET